MNINDILTLLQAGYSKSDIDQMMIANNDPAPASEKVVDSAAAAPQPEVIDSSSSGSGAADPVSPDDPMAQLTALMDRKFSELTESLKQPLMPSMGSIEPKGIDDIIRNFFKEV